LLGPILRSRRGRILKAAHDDTDGVAKRSALVLAPHPDDETLGCGATILRKVAAGTPVTVVVVADGRHSHRSEHITAEGLGAMRRAEMVEAGRRLGLPTDALRQFGYEDRTLPEHEDELVPRIADLVDELRPDEVYVTGVFEPLPDHAALGRATRRALARTGHDCLLMEYPIWLWSQVWHTISVPLPTRLSATRAAAAVLLSRRGAATVRTDGFAAAKQHALDAHVSQLRRPVGIPDTADWHGLPDPVIAAAADTVEVFIPWQRPAPRP
jgi:LmbE family N-acetylglucosaminyl deacetylase